MGKLNFLPKKNSCMSERQSVSVAKEAALFDCGGENCSCQRSYFGNGKCFILKNQYIKALAMRKISEFSMYRICNF